MTGAARVEPLKRAAIVVRDLPRSLEFYEGVLGLQHWVAGDAGPGEPVFAKLLGLPPCRLRYVILQSGEVAMGMVGLFEVQDAPVGEVSLAAPTRVNRGEVALVFHAPDVAPIFDGARAMGLEIVCPPERLELPKIGIESIEMTIRDPNGVLVNVIQPIRPRSVPYVRPGR